MSAGERVSSSEPVPMLLHCPECGARHIDEGEFATKAHHTHSCQECGLTWRPSVGPTVGVRFLPGFKSAPTKAERDDLRAKLEEAERQSLSHADQLSAKVLELSETGQRIASLEAELAEAKTRIGMLEGERGRIGSELGNLRSIDYLGVVVLENRIWRLAERWK